MGDITASTDKDVDQIIKEVKSDKLNVDKVGIEVVVATEVGILSNLDYRSLVSV